MQLPISFWRVSHGSNPGPPHTIGMQWISLFLGRHSAYYIRRQRPIYIDRQISQDPDNIQRWYERRGQLISEKGITARNIYKFDKTGFRIECAKATKVILIAEMLLQAQKIGSR